MGDSVELNPVGAQQAADFAEGIYHRIDTVVSTLKTRTAAAGAPWGDDSAGQTFYQGSNGQPGYETSGPQAITGGENMAAFMSRFAANQAAGAKALRQMDADNAAGFTAKP
jgi:hypothetical protein